MYAGCIKAGIFTLLTHILPQRGVLPLQAGCNVGKGGDATLFFGLSGARLHCSGTEVDNACTG